MKIYRLLIVISLFIQFSYAQTLQDTLAILDKTIAQYEASNPGCQVSVLRNGKVIYSKAVGLADLERKVPLTTESIIEAGSVSKQFTAAAILLLEQQGKLSLEDDVRKYVPELPNYGTPIKLHHLMHHTSGLRDWGAVAALTGWSRGTKFYANEDALEIIVRQKQLNNVPGDEFIYSNSNYNLFATIVERVSGLNLAEYTKKYIFEPAGMTHTEWRDKPNRIVANRSIAYSKENGDYVTNMPNEYVYGNGGLLTTTEDLLKWSTFYQQGKMGTSSLLSKQLQTVPLNNGEPNKYGAGLFIGKVRGWDNISHGGATAGYRAYLETFPDLKLTIAVLSNTPEIKVQGISDKITDLFVTDKTPKPKVVEKPKEEPAVVLAAETLNGYTGSYKIVKMERIITLTVKDNNLVLDDVYPLKAVSKTRFVFEFGTMEFKNGNGIFTRLNKETFDLEKIKLIVLPVQELKYYQGNYFSEETNSEVNITQKDGQLMVRLTATTIYPIQPSGKDTFTLKDINGTLEFKRNTKGELVSFKVSIDRARDVVFFKRK